MEWLYLVLLIFYSIWAFYVGLKLVSNRFEWLERDAPVNIIFKILLSVVVGYFVAGFYLCYAILKLLFAFLR